MARHAGAGAGKCVLEVISEPQPVPAAREFFPADFTIFSTQPRFLFFVQHAS